MFCNACGNKLQSAPQAPAQPEPQQPAYEQPAYQQPVYQQPVYEQPVYQQPAYQQPAYQQPAYQQPAYQQPAYQQPVYQQPAPAPVKVREPVVYKPFGLDVKTPLKKASGFIAAFIALFAPVMFVVATFSIGDLPVKMTVKSDDLDDAYEMVEEMTDIKTDVDSANVYLSAGEIKDIYEMAKDNDLEDMAEMIDAKLNVGSAAPIYIGNILFGLTCLLISAIAVFYFLKKIANVPVYDQVVGKLLKLEDPTFIICGLGVVGVILQNLFYMLAGSSLKMDEIKVMLSMGVPTITWIALFVFLLVGAVNLVAQSKEK